MNGLSARQRFPQKNLRENEVALWLKRLQVSLAFTVAVTFLILLSGCGSTAVPGRIEGTFAVTSAGNASYDIALRVPPGRMGMEPSLRLTYDSSDGSGIVGVGHLAALTFVLTLGSKERFGRSRDVECYLGLRHGEVSPEITILNSASPTPATRTLEVC